MTKVVQGAALRSIVKASATQIGIRNSELIVLNILLDCMGYKTEQARCSRATMVVKAGRCEKTIKKAMTNLRATGIIYAVAYPMGGKGCSPVYQFRVTFEAVKAYNATKTGEKIYPLTKCQLLDNGGRNFHKQGNNIPQTGEENSPPSKVSSLIKMNKEVASRSHMDKPNSDSSGERLRLFSQEVSTYGYGEARRREQERDAMAVE
jgi:hypothetical protein